MRIILAYLKEVLLRGVRGLTTPSLWFSYLKRLFFIWRWGPIPTAIAFIFVFQQNEAALRSGDLYRIAVSFGTNLGLSFNNFIDGLAAIPQKQGFFQYWGHVYNVLGAFFHVVAYVKVTKFFAWALENKNYSPALVYGGAGIIYVLLILVAGGSIPVEQFGDAVTGLMDVVDRVPIPKPSMNGSVNASNTSSAGLQVFNHSLK